MIDQLSFVVFAVAAVAIPLRTSPLITGICVVPLLGVVVAARVVGTHIRRFRERSRDAAERVSGAIGEAVEAATAIQLANARESVFDHVARLSRERLHAAVRDRLLTQSLDAIFWNAATLCTGLVLLVAARGLRAGTFTVGDLTLFVSYIGTLTEFVAVTGDFTIQWPQAGVSLERMVSLLVPAPVAALVVHRPVWRAPAARADGANAPPPRARIDCRPSRSAASPADWPRPEGRIGRGGVLPA